MIRKIIRSTLEHFPTIAQFLRNSRDALDRRAPAIMTPWGFRLAGHEAMASGTFEAEETAIVRKLLQEVDVFVNVGANVGYYCCHALSLGKPVVAFEPIARNLHYLLTNIRNNGWETQAEVFPVAVGDGANILQLWGGSTGASLIKGWASIPESYVTQVPVLPFDRLMADTLHGKRALILVDVEGAEHMVLQGASHALTNEPHPIWMVEISVDDLQPAGTVINPRLVDTFDLFFQNGYRAFTAADTALEVSKNDILDASVGKKRLSSPNFVFRHI